jgi:hypothetical protein
MLDLPLRAFFGLLAQVANDHGTTIIEQFGQ